MEFYSTIHFIDTDFGKCFYFKSTYYNGFESSKELVPTNVSNKMKMEMIRERQHHFDEKCFHIVRSKNNPNYREDNSRAMANCG
jgi:hypothetical protein